MKDELEHTDVYQYKDESLAKEEHKGCYCLFHYKSGSLVKISESYSDKESINTAIDKFQEGISSWDDDLKWEAPSRIGMFIFWGFLGITIISVVWHLLYGVPTKDIKPY